ncbi:MAG: TonB-dependent receptor plug domain-containing protein, partial [Chthoniobacterales bacterium]
MFGYWKSGALSRETPGSAHDSRAGVGASPAQTFSCGAVRGSEAWRIALAVLIILAGAAYAQDAVSPSETVELIVSATRVPIPEDEVPASVSVVTAEDFEQKQILRVADALRALPGLSVVQSGTEGQLTSVFTRGLRSEHTQVLLDGVPINQGLAGLFNF